MTNIGCWAGYLFELVRWKLRDRQGYGRELREQVEGSAEGSDHGYQDSPPSRAIPPRARRAEELHEPGKPHIGDPVDALSEHGHEDRSPSKSATTTGKEINRPLRRPRTLRVCSCLGALPDDAIRLQRRFRILATRFGRPPLYSQASSW